MRNCCQVIKKIIEKVPYGKTDFRNDLILNFKEASYTAPEDNSKWLSLQVTIQKYIPKPIEDWEVSVVSILMDIYENEVRSIIYDNTYRYAHFN